MAAARGSEHAQFFASLPPNDLLPMEQALRQVLIDWMHAKPGPFPLIEWIDRRIGGEVETRRNARGFFDICPRGAAAQAPFAPPGLPPHFVPGAPPAGGPPPPPPRGQPAPPGRSVRDEWFRKLPTDKFSSQEVALREAVFEFLATWKSQELATLRDLQVNPIVARHRAAFIPKEVPIEEWVERRIGGEVELRPGPMGAQVVCLTMEGKRLVREKYEQIANNSPATVAEPTSKDAWFSTLPEDELTNEEISLRQAVLNFLNKWLRTKPKTVPTVTELNNDPSVTQARNALLPQKVRLRMWLERRIGGEVELRRSDNPSGDYLVGLRGKMPPAGSEKSAPAPAAPVQKKSGMSAQQFFQSLPEDELTDGEQELRTAILEQLNGKDGNPPLLADVARAFQKDQHLLKIKSAVLPPEVTLQAWINRRIGGEVEIAKDGSRGQVMRMRDGGNGGAEEAAPAEEEAIDTEMQEAFFNALPGDEFLPDEEGLREALLNFLGRGRGASNVQQAKNDPEVSKYSKSLLPDDVGLGHWIQRRIGAEIEVGDAPRENMKSLRLVGAAAPQESQGTKRTGSLATAEAKRRR